MMTYEVHLIRKLIKKKIKHQILFACEKKDTFQINIDTNVKIEWIFFFLSKKRSVSS